MGKLLYWGSGLGLFVLMLRLGLWLLFWPLGLVEHLVGNSRRRQRRNLREQRRQTAALERVAKSVA